MANFSDVKREEKNISRGVQGSPKHPNKETAKLKYNTKYTR